MEKTIYLVIEDGAGIVHEAFETKEDAIYFKEFLEKEHDMYCFRVEPINYNYKSEVTIP